MSKSKNKSKLEEWAYELDPDYPQDGTVEAIKTQTHRELMRKRSTHGALWLSEQAREWCESPSGYIPIDVPEVRKNKGSQMAAYYLLKHLEQLCGKEGES